MEILKRFKADRHVRQLQSGARLTDAQLLECRTQLAQMGGAAVRALFAAVQHEAATDLTLDMLVRLLSEDTLAGYLDALRSPSGNAADAATRALSRASTIDPARLLALYSGEEFSRARVESILEAQSARMHPEALVRLLPELGHVDAVTAALGIAHPATT